MGPTSNLLLPMNRQTPQLTVIHLKFIIELIIQTAQKCALNQGLR